LHHRKPKLSIYYLTRHCAKPLATSVLDIILVSLLLQVVEVICLRAWYDRCSRNSTHNWYNFL